MSYFSLKSLKMTYSLHSPLLCYTTLHLFANTLSGSLAYFYFTLPFFFSSRRRHTSSLRDWSSDVCSSDLHAEAARLYRKARARGGVVPAADALIGRASCRERVYISVVSGAVKKKRWRV